MRDFFFDAYGLRNWCFFAVVAAFLGAIIAWFAMVPSRGPGRSTQPWHRRR